MVITITVSTSSSGIAVTAPTAGTTLDTYLNSFPQGVAVSIPTQVTGTNLTSMGKTINGDSVWRIRNGDSNSTSLSAYKENYNSNFVGLPNGTDTFVLTPFVKTLILTSGNTTYTKAPTTQLFSAQNTFSTTEQYKIMGTNGNDTLTGANAADTLIGGLGNDLLTGLGGNDNLSGDAGIDTLLGGDGNDSLNGGTENDSLSGDAGIDTLLGGDGNDNLSGGTENDSLSGDAGNDTLNGGAGNDTLNGGTENDSLSGDAGIDTLNGGDGNDTLNGDTENDKLNGEAGNDTLNGGAGDDYLNGGAGTDTLYGGAGKDNLNGDLQNDRLYGDEDNDTLIGGSGDDTLTGGTQTDRFVFANQGIDTITDFSVNDTVNGVDVLAIQSNKYSNAPAAGTTPLLNLANISLGTTNIIVDTKTNISLLGSTVTNARFAYTTDTNQLLYDADGNWTSNTTVIANVNTIANLTANNFLFV
ncbi:calcium-binding protein [Gloeothece verrucosa]|uniref:Hemolysin-type calcium-binding region n=1 Tax=Gloeothece verrucosa (strain PCC 7822) TaxID=497965 RepID=E0U879_GLOV7|nr:calcium-binding protein [Gloeothece verrucosa]ADN17284.1 Hemolysin-type calcium-binding region [Gloeothece verrucosa PCC 7822]